MIKITLRPKVDDSELTAEPDPMDIELLEDPAIHYKHSEISTAQNDWNDLQRISLWDLSRTFQLRVIGVENLYTSAFKKQMGTIDPSSTLFYLEAGLYHGGALVNNQRASTAKQRCCLNPRWYEWLDTNMVMSNIPRAARVCFTLYAVVKSKDPIPLGWVSCQLFDYKHELKTGLLSLRMYPNEAANPIGTCVQNPDPAAMTLFIQLPEYPLKVVFPTEPLYGPAVTRNIPKMHKKLEGILKAMIKRDPLTELSAEDKKIFWEYRYHLTEQASALPKFLLSVPYDDRNAVQEAHHLLREWVKIESTIDGLELLDAKYADAHVRQFAVKCLEELSNDELNDFLLQLVQVLKYEPYHDSALSRFLVRRALRDPRIGHNFFWYLKSEMHVPQISERYGLLLEAYLRGCGQQLKQLLMQDTVMNQLTDIANLIKQKKESERKEVLLKHLAAITFPKEPFPMPLDCSLQATGLIVDKCKYMDSKKLPLWLVFENPENPTNPIFTIFKAGDDLRQDMLTLQMLRIMDKLWKKNNLDLFLSPYGCISTGDQLGMIEVVMNSVTTAHISKAAAGIQGAFRLDPIANWLKEHNPGDRYRKAVDTFTLSCAGYCVATYVLGIGDRHNDNIMITKSGRLFHIDFGHFLGNYKKKFGIKRERAPFVLTPDFAYVMGGRDSKQFKKFINICFKAYNILRKQANLFINLFALMISTGIPELTSSDDILYLREALALEMPDKKAKDYFTKLINESLATKTTQFNNTIHLIFH